MHLPPPEPRDDELYAHMGSTYTPTADYTDPLRMVGSDIQQSPELTAFHDHLLVDNAITLDARRLQGQHTTEGYRDGITAGKAESIQAGFDEGFGLGAEIGLKVGQILGLLQGMAAALTECGSHDSAHINQLIVNATKELSVESIFAEEYWASDGSWKYTVTGSEGNDEILFNDIAREHPVIMKWERVVGQEIDNWGLDRNLTIVGFKPLIFKG
ncbi:hypothetical protein F5Y04DRAFT_233195 [Hypomontagnella monticulosa]|nr:hypothetical protein F5Y04DRAFT_233195 [Hypomontagnella monticulosa]